MSPIKRVSNGWLITCPDCTYESFAVRRPAADKDIHNHRKIHLSKENN